MRSKLLVFLEIFDYVVIVLATMGAAYHFEAIVYYVRRVTDEFLLEICCSDVRLMASA